MQRYVIGLMAGLVCGWPGGAAVAQSPAAVDWSGFYVSGLAGGTKNQPRVQSTVGISKYLDATDERQINRNGNNNLDQWRPAGGLAGGYSKQFGNVLVGVEASANTLFLNKDHVINERIESVNNGTRMNIKQSVSADWQATLRPRLGWAQDNWLGYVTGGLAVHAIENIEISLGWAEAMAKVHGTDNVNRDMIIAALTLHDWAKVWYVWDDATHTVKRPDWFPEYWGGAEGIAKWKWMGGHGAIVYSEMMKRGAPDSLVVATAAAHFDAFWDVDRASGKEGLNAALAEAAKLAQMPAIKVDPAKRMAEWFMIVYSDGSWSYSHYIAGQFAHNWVREVAQGLGIDPKSGQANKLANFVLTRISDFRLYNLYQSAGFDAAVPKKLILEILQDSTAYEVPAG